MRKKDERPSHAKGMSKIDKHLYNAMQVQKYEFFIVDAVSSNEVAGLLVGTEVRRIRDVESWPSKYWRGMYYSTIVECPNGETRRLCCDVLSPRRTDRQFRSQAKMFNEQVAA